MNGYFEKSLHALLNTKDVMYKNLESCYKLPLALFLCGDKRNAELAEKYIYDTYSIDGSFKRINERRCIDYYNYWLYMYYHFSGSPREESIYQSIMQSKHTTATGFLCVPNVDKRELRATAFSGICAYLHEDMKTHLFCSKFIVDLCDENDITDIFYMIMPYDDILPNRKDRLNIYCTEQESPLYYALSLAIINLCLSYKLSGIPLYLEYAERYTKVMDLSRSKTLHNSYSGKLCVALSLLYKVSGDDKYKQTLLSVVDNIYRARNPDGFWYLNNDISYDRTSEFTSLLLLSHEIVGELYASQYAY